MTLRGDDKTRLVLSARRALELVDEDPQAAWQAAEESLARARQARDLAALAVAHRAAGLAALHLAHLDTATAHLREAVRVAGSARSVTLVGEARMSLAFAHARRGEVQRALRCIEAALVDLDGTPHARALAQRGAIRQQLGRVEDALRDYDAAMPALKAADDWVWVQRVHSNRGHLYAYRSLFAQAEAELERAEAICRRHGLEMKLAIVHDNRGLLEIRRGDVPAALHHLAEAERRHQAFGAPVGAVLVDRSEVLLSVRLLAEAREAAELAVAEFTRLRRRMNLPEAQLLVATAALLDGDARSGLEAAAKSARLFAAQGRRGWAALARHTALRCRLALADGRRVSAAELVRTADDLAREGWLEPALDARLLAARVLLQRQRVDLAVQQLEQARTARRTGTAELRARAWHAEALVRLAAGQRRAAFRALGTGMRILEEHQATLGATDLRSSVSAHREDLVRLGLRLVMESRRARAVLAWAERGRATALLAPPARPPDDAELQAALAELRAVNAELEDERATGSRAAAVARRRVALERTIRDLARLRSGVASRSRRTSLDELATALGDDALVEYVELDGTLSAVSVVGGRVRLHPLAPLSDIRASLDQIAFALRRLAVPRSSAATAAAATALRAAATRVDSVILEPLLGVIGDRPLVLVPTGPLQSLPVGVLPSCRGRAVTVAPSAALFRRAASVGPRAGAALVVAGPGLAAAPGEARDVAASYDEVQLLSGPQATVEAVSKALPTARLAHVAAHGYLRADNPLFSALRLADGPLTVYDIESLSQVPPVVVLAACDTARSRVTSGDELLGLAGCFLALGAGTLIAPLVRVGDTATAPLMVALHQHLRAGVAPAQALARLRDDRDDPAAAAAAAALVCLGSGRVPSTPNGGMPALPPP